MLLFGIQLFVEMYISGTMMIRN